MGYRGRKWSVTMASGKTIPVGGKDTPFDDSDAILSYVDVKTSNMTADGIVYFGLGSVIGAEAADIHVKGVVHLRMTPKLARHVAEGLMHSADRAEEQQKLILGLLPRN
jgi:hypothetical protein